MKGADIRQDELGLVERAHEVLALRQVNGGLSTDGGVHHGEQACWHLRERQAAQVSRRDKAGKVAHYAASDRDYQVAALRLALCEPAIYKLRSLQRLMRLACWHNEHVRRDAGGFERELRAARLPMHSLVGDDVCSGNFQQGVHTLAYFVDDVPANPYRVVPLGCVDDGGEVGIGSHVGMSVFHLVRFTVRMLQCAKV